MSIPQNSALRALTRELNNLKKEPPEGFVIKLVSESNLFDWEIAIFGPPDTVYAGGYFKLTMKFPQDYPYSPPTVRFTNKIWHPNVYRSGELCISILHPPVDDPQSGELVCERWNPTQTVRTILLSIISLLTEPNTQSPANVEASMMYRRWKESNDEEYVRIIHGLVQASKEEAVKDGVVIPTTVEEYVVRNYPSSNSLDIIDYDQHTVDSHDTESNAESTTTSKSDDTV